jgi:hypothetical protein
MPRRKRKTYDVPVRLEWVMKIPADTKEQAVHYAEGRLNVITSFGANVGRTGKVDVKGTRVSRD